MEIKFDNVNYICDKVNYKSKEILKNVNIVFSDNKINTIIGKNGSGKTTLVELIYGLIKPTSGNIYADSIKIEKEKIESLRFDIGFVFQKASEQFFSKTVKEELEVNFKLYNYKIYEKNKRINDALMMVNLEKEVLNKNIDELSNSEKKLLSLAIALLLNPKVLILDEPTAGLDDSNKTNLIKIITILKNRYKKNIIITSNDMDFVLKVSDIVYVLSNKNIVISGKKLEILKDETILKKYGIEIPNIIKFQNRFYKNHKVNKIYRDEINDVIKDIYRYVK